VRNEQLMRSVLESTADAVFVKDGEGKYLLFNAAAARFAASWPTVIGP
jgi:PAS fold.